MQETKERLQKEVEGLRDVISVLRAVSSPGGGPMLGGASVLQEGEGSMLFEELGF